ncbi:MAG: serine/threonine-protein phosphatase [Actinobacteria bacterium]|nr:serine/threonine-protein phosphatase [Actinomycetota bacterium]
MNELSLRFVGRSEIGHVRKNNEDSGYASTDLLVVADGMGGHSAGELASAATVAAVVSACENSQQVDELLTLLSDAVITSGEYIADVVSSNRELTGMGTTLTAIAMREDRIAMAHVGDSRAYLMRDGELLQMTKDHTYVQSLVDTGEITADEAIMHPRRNLLMRAIDGIHAVEVDLSVREARIGDRFLLCSDGLCGVISDEKIADALQLSDPTQSVTELIDKVLSAGAPDNVTVIIADVITDGELVDPVLVGAAIENETQERLPDIDFPDELSTEPAVEIAQTEFARSKRSWLKPVVATLLAIALVMSAGVWWLANQWYLAEYKPTHVVAVYQGIPTGGLSRLIDVSDIPIKSLPAFEQQQLGNTIDALTYEDAVGSLNRLKARATLCQQASAPQSCGDSNK